MSAVHTRLRQGALAACIALLCSGCATFRSYDAEMRRPLSLLAAGRIDAAVGTLERSNRGDDKDLLYYMELGELQRLDGRYDSSDLAWRAAQTRVQDWEAKAKLDPVRTSGAVLSYALNDKLRPYEGEDYEKVMLTARMALNYLAEGDWEKARVAIKQTHEREAVIGEVRRKQYEQIEEQARRNGAGISAKDLNGYPVQTIDNVEVNALRNSYQSAFSHYMAGFIYEALGEPSLAAAGYRQAIELHPQTRMLEDALAGLEDRLAAGDDGWSDVLVAIETGFVPARVSRQFPLPIPVDGRLVLVPVSFPVLRNVDPGNWLPNVRIDDDIVSPVAITSVDAMARRALKDEMPGIMLRAFVRSTAKAIVQYQAQREADLRRRRRGEDAAGVLLDVASIALMIGAVATESADERSWRSLPANIWMARAKLRRGPHRISVPTDAGERSAGFAVSGRYGFIALRVVGNQLFAATSIPALEPVDRPGGRTHALPAAPR